MITFPVGEGSAPGYLALPKNGAGARATNGSENAEARTRQAPASVGEGPGVLVLHAWWGLNDFFKAFCDRLAQQGYVALAPDVYHGKIATTIDEAQEIRKTFESEQEQARANAELTAAVTYLRQHPAVKGQGIACVGFSMGGWSSYELSVARPADVVAVAAFYGVGNPEADYSAARAAYLGQYVLHDEWEEDAYVDLLEKKLRADGREATFYRYEGLSHWFMEDNRPDVYNAGAARLAWERLLEFLRRHLTRAA